MKEGDRSVCRDTVSALCGKMEMVKNGMMEEGIVSENVELEV